MHHLFQVDATKNMYEIKNYLENGDVSTEGFVASVAAVFVNKF